MARLDHVAPFAPHPNPSPGGRGTSISRPSPTGRGWRAATGEGFSNPLSHRERGRGEGLGEARSMARLDHVAPFAPHPNPSRAGRGTSIISPSPIGRGWRVATGEGLGEARLADGEVGSCRSVCRSPQPLSRWERDFHQSLRSPLTPALSGQERGKEVVHPVHPQRMIRHHHAPRANVK